MESIRHCVNHYQETVRLNQVGINSKDSWHKRFGDVRHHEKVMKHEVENVFLVLSLHNFQSLYMIHISNIDINRKFDSRAYVVEVCMSMCCVYV